MSATCVTGYAIIGGLVEAAIGIADAGIEMHSRHKGRKIGKTLLSDVTDELGRVHGSGGERAKLRSDLENLRGAIERRLGDGAGMDKLVDELNALRIRIRAAELDDE